MNTQNSLVVEPTHLKNINISQIGNLPQVRVKIQKIWNHRLDTQKWWFGKMYLISNYFGYLCQSSRKPYICKNIYTFQNFQKQDLRSQKFRTQNSSLVNSKKTKFTPIQSFSWNIVDSNSSWTFLAIRKAGKAYRSFNWVNSNSFDGKPFSFWPSPRNKQKPKTQANSCS